LSNRRTAPATGIAAATRPRRPDGKRW